eukprot:1633172-Pyramimonas_sp.AAC.1
MEGLRTLSECRGAVLKTSVNLMWWRIGISSKYLDVGATLGHFVVFRVRSPQERSDIHLQDGSGLGSANH